MECVIDINCDKLSHQYLFCIQCLYLYELYLFLYPSLVYIHPSYLRSVVSGNSPCVPKPNCSRCYVHKAVPNTSFTKENHWTYHQKVELHHERLQKYQKPHDVKLQHHGRHTITACSNQSEYTHYMVTRMSNNIINIINGACVSQTFIKCS